MISKIVAPIIIVSSLVLASCGGSGGSGSSADEGITYTGSKSPASVDAGNAEALAIAATGGSNQAIAADTANGANPFSPKGSETNPNLVSKLIEQLEIIAATRSRIAQQLLPICDPGGMADLDQNTDGTQGTIVFTNCTITGGNGEVVNGTVTFNATISGTTLTSLDMWFTDFSVTYQGETHAIDLTVLCAGSPLVCDLFSDFVGLDGRIYRVEITIVTNTAGASYDVDATVYDPAHGYFTVDASVNFNNCPGGVPETGTLIITGDAATTASVVFNDCDSFTVTHLGVPTVYLWTNIL